MKSCQTPFFSEKNPVFFIAEVGASHEGEFEYARKLTSLAISSGADAVKFQFYTGDSLVSPIESPEKNSHFKDFELTKAQYLELVRMVDAGGAVPMASVWDMEMLSWADSVLPIHKVGSGDLTCYPILQALVSTGKPIILSTGLCELDEVAEAVAYIETCDSSYIRERKLALLQCTSSYPTPDEDANIDAMLTLKREFELPVGYSDHTLGSDAIETAVALGAEIIEKHFTDTREGKGFHDHHVSLTKNEVQKTLNKMRRIVALKGASSKILTSSESKKENHINFRRGIYANRNMRIGQTITLDDLVFLRPLRGICASRFGKIIGKKMARNIVLGSALQESDIQ